MLKWMSDVEGEVCQIPKLSLSGAGWPVMQNKASRRIQIPHIKHFVGVVLLYILSEAGNKKKTGS